MSTRVASGAHLGPYELVSLLGAGGMGEVWRARDTRLDRNVAIKVLPSEFSADARLKARFEREAKAISQLNHPNICSLFDVGRHEDTDFLVMELIEGETLADRLLRGAMPLPSLIRHGIEIAEALATAHRRGIVHRDLKPQNIMITKSGAKLLDFGLAKPAGLVVPVLDGATEQKPLTAEGTIVGTFQYMSPEQLEGADLDQRSDIFSLGAVLYEMATGRRAFDGGTRTSIIAAIVTSEPPPIADVQPLSPPRLEQLIRGCITKDPDSRVQSAHDVAMQLRWIGENAGAGARSPGRTWLPWFVAALLALLLAAGTFVHFRMKEIPRTLRLTIPAPAETAIDGVPAISPDGRRIVFRSVAANGSDLLWLRNLDSIEATPLKGTEGATFAFWSPDGRNLGFFARGKMWRRDMTEGSVQMIYEPIESPPGGASWNSHDVILFAPRVQGTLMRISASGGPAVPIPASKNEIAYWPWFLPDGDHYLYKRELVTGPTGVYLASLSGGLRKQVLQRNERGYSRPAYAAGRLFFASGRSLYAQTFDVGKLETEGEPEKIDDEIQYYSPGRASFSVSDGGTIAYQKSVSPLVAQLTFVDRAGRKLGTAGPPTPYADFQLSPDGQRVLFARHQDDPTIWILDVARGSETRAVLENWSIRPAWMPDGRGFVYAAAVKGSPNLYLHHAGGSSERLTTSDEQNYPRSVTPDGRFIICDFTDPLKNVDVYAVPVAAPHTPVPIVSSRFREEGGVVSPDGRWLAYTSDESGTVQIYAASFPDATGRVQISTTGGTFARWSHDGRELFYFDPASKRVLSVSIRVAGGELVPSIPQPLFTLESGRFDVTADGRFLVGENRINPDAPGLTVVVNWHPHQ